MKFYGPEDLTDENFERFCQEIDEISRKGDEENKRLAQQPTPEFSTIEEFQNYCREIGAIPFEEWERQMMDRLGGDPLETLTDEQRQHFESSLAEFESDREQEEFIEQCRRELEARVEELRLKRQK